MKSIYNWFTQVYLDVKPQDKVLDQKDYAKVMHSSVLLRKYLWA